MKVADLWAKLQLRPDKASFSSADRLLGAVKTALVGIVAFKSVKWAAGLIQQTADTADQFNKMSKQIGVSSEALQGLEFAAQLSGTNIQVLRKGLQRLAKNAFDANDGMITAKEAFSNIGVSATDAHGELLPTDQILGDIAEKFKAMPDGTKKTALAMNIFGKAGAELIPLLDEGRDGISKLTAEFGELGALISTETGKSFEDFNDAQLRIKTAFIGLRNQAVIALLPMIKKLADSFLLWVKANKELFKQKLISFMRALVTVAKGLIGVFGLLTDVIHWVDENWRILVMSIGAVVVALAILKAESIAAAIASGMAWLASLLPFALMAAAVLALILIIEDIWVALNGGESAIVKLWGIFVDYIGERIANMLGMSVQEWKDSFTEFSDWAIAKIQAVVDYLADAFQAVSDFIDKYGIKKEFKRMEPRKVLNKATGKVEPVLSTAITPDRTAEAQAWFQQQTQAAGPSNITINAQGLSASEVADEVDKRVNGKFREAAATL